MEGQISSWKDGKEVLGSYGKQLDEGFSKFGEDMINLRVKIIGCEEWSPSLEDRMCDFQDTKIDLSIFRRESRNQVLEHFSIESPVDIDL
jgi:hypothetical protein